MIVWSGKGFLVVLLVLGVLVPTEYVVEKINADEQYYQTHGWPMALGLLVAAAAVWFIGRKVNGGPSRTFIDKATGQEVTVKPTNTLFFLRMEYWAPILAAGAVLALLLR